MSRLALYLLGPPRLELDSEPVHIGRHVDDLQQSIVASIEHTRTQTHLIRSFFQYAKLEL